MTARTHLHHLIADLRAAGWRRCVRPAECGVDRCWHRGAETVQVTYGLFATVLWYGGLRVDSPWIDRHGLDGLHRLAEAAGVLASPQDEHCPNFPHCHEERLVRDDAASLRAEEPVGTWVSGCTACAALGSEVAR